MPYRLTLVVFLCTFCPGLLCAAFAGAWTQTHKGYYLKLTALSLSSRSNLDSLGVEVDKPGMGQLTDLNLTAYIEYGLSKRLTLVAALPYKRLEDERAIADLIAIERTWGLGDLETRLRWKLRDTPLVASLAVGAKIPLGYAVDAETRVPLGTGEVDGDIRLLLGRSLYPFPGYLTGEIGYRARGGPYSGEIFYALEAGASSRKFMFKGHISALRTRGTCGATGQAGLIGDQDILKVSPGLIYRFSESAELSLDLIHIASGCNTTTGSSLGMGLALKR
jgi:hypothetical protein